MLRALGLERFNTNKLKPHLKMAEQRLNILNTKKTALIKQQKKEIAALLRDGKEEKARIRVEHLIRLDFTIEAYELLALLCELFHERVALINSEKDCPVDMKETLSTLIYAAPRTEVPELNEVTRQLELKYGLEFVEEARSNRGECVNGRVVHKLGVSPPSALLVMKYLTAIAKEHGVDNWTPAETGLDEEAMATQSMPGPSGFSVQVAPGSNLAQAYADTTPVPVSDQPPLAAVVPPPPVGYVTALVPPSAPVKATAVDDLAPGLDRDEAASSSDSRRDQGAKKDLSPGQDPSPQEAAQEGDATPDSVPHVEDNLHDLIPSAPQTNHSPEGNTADYELLQQRFNNLRK